ncbi:MAG: hypothetical protein AAF493_09090 [Pseudomonadota bacterium]
MPISFALDAARRIITATVQGELTFSDMRDYIDAVSAHGPLAGGDWIEVLDLGGATVVDLSFNAIHELRQQRVALPAPGIVATTIHAPSPLTYGISRILQALQENEGHQTLIARDGIELARDIENLLKSRARQANC